MTVKAGIPLDSSLGARVMKRRLSGVVKVDGNPAIRQVMAYLVRTPQTLVTTWSAINGTWDLTINIGKDDEARVFAVGQAGENSVIFEHIT